MGSDAFDDLMRAGVEAEAAGRVSAALACYCRAVPKDPGNAVSYLYLAWTLLRSGEVDRAVQVTSLGADRNPGMLRAWRNAALGADMRQRSHDLDQAYRSFMTDLNARHVREFESSAGARAPVVRRAIWCQTHTEEIAWGDPQQQPWLLYLPDLAARPWTAAHELAWAADLQEMSRRIAREALHALSRQQDMPYLSAEGPVDAALAPLQGSDRWSSIHLYRAGVANDDALQQLPVTARALSGCELTQLNGQPVEAFLSVLAAGTEIPPHHGLSNASLTVHLPLAVPGDCTLTVAGERRVLNEGQVLAFDDTFLHSAENSGASPRVNLIFEAWRPDLDEIDRRALEYVWAQRDLWNRSRALPEVGHV